jgi:hypothetical protein
MEWNTIESCGYGNAMVVTREGKRRRYAVVVGGKKSFVQVARRNDPFAPPPPHPGYNVAASGLVDW